MYAHTQRSRLMLTLLFGASIIPFVLLLSIEGRAMPLAPRIATAAAALVMLLAALLFSALTIEVGDGMLAWHFGPGLWRKSVALASIVDLAPTKTSFLEGWGIHLTRRGWLYNVAGREAVLVTLRDGNRFLLGTDEPQALVQAIRVAQGRVEA